MNRHTFDLVVEHSHYDDRTYLRIQSQRYGLRLSYGLRQGWGDHRPLADHIRRVVGGTLEAWDRANLAGRGREMAQALIPHWEAEIHHFMERMEAEQLYREIRRDPDWAHFYGDGAKEDPKAKKKARELLMRNLDEGQLNSFKKDGSFAVLAKDGKVYTISASRSFNVKAEDGTRYCGQTPETPIEDQMLAQKLLLQHDPEKFFKNSNVSPAYNSQQDWAYATEATCVSYATWISW